MTKTAKKTQEQIVREKLAKDGFISNLWAINRGIWRLGAVIWDIRHAENGSINIVGAYGSEILRSFMTPKGVKSFVFGKRHRKNTFYWPVSTELTLKRLHAMNAER